MADQSGAETYASVKYSYTRAFDPIKGVNAPADLRGALAGGDRPKESPYHYDEEIILAVNAALAADRPLLVAGVAGTGKSALAANIAAQEGWEYEAEVITARTEGRDLLWRFDTVRRLRDAYRVAPPPPPAPPPPMGDPGLSEVESAQRVSGDDAELRELRRYVQRGVLWKAFVASKRTVVLIDEIDKADPDVPNSLLEVLGNGQFTCTDTGETIDANRETPPFVVITTNNERELSRPFRRRCVALRLKPPDEERLVEIADSWKLSSEEDPGLVRALAKEVIGLNEIQTAQGRLNPNVAEYLDALRVCITYGVRIGDPEWQALKQILLVKDLEPGERPT